MTIVFTKPRIIARQSVQTDRWRRILSSRSYFQLIRPGYHPQGLLWCHFTKHRRLKSCLRNGSHFFGQTHHLPMFVCLSHERRMDMIFPEAPIDSPPEKFCPISVV